MADVWGFNDRETAERLKEIASVPQTINRVVTERRKRPGAIGGGGILVRTPSLGISGATLSGTTYSLGAALCAVYEILAGSGSYVAIPTGESLIVCNMVPIQIRGNTLVQAKQVNGQYVVDVEPCSVTYSATPTTPSPEEA